MADSADCFCHPLIKLHPAALIFQIIAQYSGELSVVRPAVLIPVNVFLDNNLICQRLIRRHQNDPPVVASFMKSLRIQEVFKPAGVSDKLLRGNPRVVDLQEISLCLHVDLQISPRILLDCKRFLARLVQ